MIDHSCLQVQQLISELNEILAHGGVDENGHWKTKLQPQSRDLFDFLPSDIQDQLLLERDPHGNVQVYFVPEMPFFPVWSQNFNGLNISNLSMIMKVAKIETEKMLISMVETELARRKTAGLYSGNFKGQSHFFGYGFDSTLILQTACINVLDFKCAYIRCRRNAWGFFGPGCDY